VKEYEMTFVKYFRKLMGWCPMKDSLQREKHEENFPGFKLENMSQLVPPSTSLEGKVLKAQVSLSKDNGIAEFAILELIIVIILAIYSSGSSVFKILSLFITYLVLLTLILYNRNTVLLTPEKVIIRRHLFKSLVLRKEDIMKISVSKNKNHSLRWPIRLLYLAVLPMILLQKVEGITRGLQVRETAPDSAKLSLFLVTFIGVAFLLVIYYIFELLTPYQQTLKITTRSDLELWFYTGEPEEMIAILRNEKE
jgi:hypothetical protein